MTVCAFVLTRDRKALLVECLRSLLEQTAPVERIIVLDNASSDGTEELLRAQGLLDRIQFVRREVNTGGAGGYRTGVRLALETGCDWIWLMDDDAEPQRCALERMLAAPVAGDPQTVALCTAVRHPDGTLDPLHRCRDGLLITPLPDRAYESYATVDCASFVGLMVRAEAAGAAGLPRAEFFLGYDDAEYSLRLGRHGVIRLVPDAVTLHKLPIGGGTSTRRARLWNRVLGQHHTTSAWPDYWKDLYRVRNFMWIRRERGALEFAAALAAYCVKCLLYDPQPLRRLPWIVRFARKGRRGDFSAPTPEQWAARARVSA